MDDGNCGWLTARQRTLDDGNCGLLTARQRTLNGGNCGLVTGSVDWTVGTVWVGGPNRRHVQGLKGQNQC